MASITPLQLAFRYNESLPPRIRSYLNGRGISDRIIRRALLGWNGVRITIPIFDREGRVSFFKLAKDPDVQTGPKMLVPAGTRAELYGWEHTYGGSLFVIICEGEFDRLVLEDRGIPAVTSTGGAGVFRSEWAAALNPIQELYICFDRDEAGREGARRVGRLLPHAALVELPDEVGEGGDITDYFVRLGRTRDEFLELLRTGKPIPTGGEQVRKDQTSHHSINSEAARLKSLVRIEEVIGRYLPLHQSGENQTAPCPFHEDSTPSFVVFPGTQSFHCFGCHAHGDVIAFVMRKERLSFSEALTFLTTFHQNDQ